MDVFASRQGLQVHRYGTNPLCESSPLRPTLRWLHNRTPVIFSLSKLLAQLENLPTGQSRSFYRDELRRRGYEIERVSISRPDELRLRIRKDNRPMAVVVAFDNASGRSTSIRAVCWDELTQAPRTRLEDLAELTRPAMITEVMEHWLPIVGAEAGKAEEAQAKADVPEKAKKPYDE